MEFFNSLETLPPLLKTFWYIAIPVSVIFLLQAILTFVGGGDGCDNVDMDAGADGEHGHSSFFSLKNLTNFLLGFSWAGIALYSSIASPTLLAAVATLVGLGFVWIFFLIIRQIEKLAEDNSFRLSSVLGRQAEVYLPIPANKLNSGKVLISVGGSVRELPAMTTGECIANGQRVTVVALEDGLLMVELERGISHG
ncbi:MAG: NfeD family protein [Deltaproteobacteria bacterium]|nr:NfeD family protein [Deltaproteobacteria bacterium]